MNFFFRISLLFVLPAIFTTGCTGQLTRYEVSQPHMGTLVKIIFYCKSEQSASRAAEAAFARVEQLNQALSDYLPDSELSQLSNSAGSGRAVVVGPDLWELLVTSQQLAAESEGAFDITVGPVIQLWRQARRNRQLPPDSQLAAATALVGFEHISLDAKHRTATLKLKGMRLDLGGIAKGFTGNKVLDVLHQHGVSRALVAVGGDIVVSGAPHGKQGWTVAIKPFADEQTAKEAGHDSLATRYILLHQGAISTSGDAFQYVVIDGKRYSHIVDPQTGLGLTRPMGVTVIAPRRSGGGTTTDSYATALSVMGPKKGMRLIESKPGVAAIFVLAEEQGEIKVEESQRVNKLHFTHNP